MFSESSLVIENNRYRIRNVITGAKIPETTSHDIPANYLDAAVCSSTGEKGKSRYGDSVLRGCGETFYFAGTPLEAQFLATTSPHM